MIEVVVGLIGGGKTCTCVSRMAQYVSHGGVVYTNVTINWEGFCRLCRKKWGYEPDRSQVIVEDEAAKIKSFHKHVPQGTPDQRTLAVIDEAHEYWNARRFKDADPEFLSFMTHSRKLCVDMIFITQAALNLDAQVRRLAQFIWVCQDMQQFRIPGLNVRLGLIPMFRHRQFQEGECVRSEWIAKDPLVFGAYDTFELKAEFSFSMLKWAGKTGKKVKDEVDRMWGSGIAVGWCMLALVGIGQCRIGKKVERYHEGYRNLRRDLRRGGVVEKVPVGEKEKAHPGGDNKKVVRRAPLRATEWVRFQAVTGPPRRPVVWVGEASYSAGRVCPEGYVVRCTDREVVFRRPDGSELVWVNVSG